MPAAGMRVVARVGRTCGHGSRRSGQALAATARAASRRARAHAARSRRTRSSASTRRISISASSANSSAPASARCTTSVRRSGRGARSAPTRSAAAPISCCACFRSSRAIYARHGVDAAFVGHPLADAIPLDPDHAAARAALGLSDDVPVLALLPGSRLGEIARLGADFFDAAATAERAIAELRNRRRRWRTPRAATPLPKMLADDPTVRRAAQRDPPDRRPRARGDDRRGCRSCSRPAPPRSKRCWRSGRWSSPIASIRSLTGSSRRSASCRQTVYSLPNVLAGRVIVPELMQDDCTAPALARDAVCRCCNRGALILHWPRNFAACTETAAAPSRRQRRGRRSSICSDRSASAA